jgi:hypothetical protein
MATLNGRISRLEAATATLRGPDHCRVCGLRHVYPLTLAIVRALIRVEGGGYGPPTGDGAPRLCLCDCCADGRYLARLSHGLAPEEDAA